VAKKNKKQKELNMKNEIIDSIAKELNKQNQVFQEQVVMKELNENGLLFNVFSGYKEKFFPVIDKKEFAVIYSHTVIFVLLNAALFKSNRSGKIDLKKALANIIQQLKGMDPIILEILTSITLLDIPGPMSAFIVDGIEKIRGVETAGLKEEDILPLLYQRFLKRYEPGLHKTIRYYYTPGPVVGFMVYMVHRLLKEKLNMDEGLADLDMHIMDPAFGTGNYLGEVMQVAVVEKIKKYGAGIMIHFMETYFSTKIFGFEIMLPLYVLGYIHLRKIIKSFCVGTGSVSQWVSGSVGRKVGRVEGNKLRKTKMRLNGLIGSPISMPCGPLAGGCNLYLADALKYLGSECGPIQKKPVRVIFCNPPYSRHSSNKGKQVARLLKDYLLVKNERIKEKNLKGLQDDYVKFIRLAQCEIDQNESGVMAFISSNSYLENPTFRGMRYSLLKSFDEIYILDLHGTAVKVKKKDDDDENIFDVSIGIAMGFFIKLKRPYRKRENPGSPDCRVFYASIKGGKASKLKKLEELKNGDYKAVQWERVYPTEDFYLFTPGEQVEIYKHFIKVTDIFPVHGVGIVTARDKLTIKESESEVDHTIYNFFFLDETKFRELYRLGNDTRDWQFKEAKKDIFESGIDVGKIVPILYRPFDLRYTYYTGKCKGFICMPRSVVMRHMLQDNIGLVTVRQVPGGVFNHCFAADTIIDSRITDTQKGIAYIFPLYKYIFPNENKNKRAFDYNKVYPVPGMTRHCNIDPAVFTRLREIFGKDKLPSAEQIFYYTYAILNSGIYRERYRDHLKIDFPRIPFTSDSELFMRLSNLGEKLAAVHLMRSRELEQTFSKFEVIGNNLVEGPLFKPSLGEDGRVYINKTQYFSSISEELWNYEVCGYQVLQKWLMSRINRILTPVEILHYIKISRSLQLTIKYSKAIDILYSRLERTL